MDGDGKTLAGQNPLLEPWTGPYGGVPPFDRVKVEHFEPALEAAMEAQLAEIDTFAAAATSAARTRRADAADGGDGTADPAPVEASCVTSSAPLIACTLDAVPNRRLGPVVTIVKRLTDRPSRDHASHGRHTGAAGPRPVPK